MANVSRPRGLSPVGYLNGSPWNGAARKYYATAPAAGLFVGDPVTTSGTADANGIMGVTIGVAGSAICGVVVAVLPANDGAVSLVGTTVDLASRSLAGSTSGYVLVCDDPQVIFEIQEALTTPFAITDVGANCNFLIAAGAAAYSDSATTTAVAAPTTTSTLNLKILGLAQKPDNAVGLYAKLLVMINNHQYGSVGTAGI